MKTLVDLHTHTVASGHAYSSLQEMAHAAAEKGIEVLGITEHGPNIPNTCGRLYFKNSIVIPREMYGVKLLIGAELNILDTKGNIDGDEQLWNWLDIRIAGMHSVCWKGGTVDENTHGMITAIRNPYIHIISHPADGTAELNFKPIVEAAKEAHTLLEINSHSLHPKRHKTMARDNNLELLRFCKQMEVPVILGSDAHISFSIGNYDYVLPLLAEIEFPHELIMNDKPKELFQYINLRIPQTEQYFSH
ncbi:MAG: phosphatase [Muribaculaceae bacterium]|nr:phosphatase [Muribaculaceae bacterium]